MELSDQIRHLGMHPDDALKLIQQNLETQGYLLDSVITTISDYIGASLFAQEKELASIQRKLTSTANRRIKSQEKKIDKVIDKLQSVAEQRLSEQGAELASLQVRHQEYFQASDVGPNEDEVFDPPVDLWYISTPVMSPSNFWDANRPETKNLPYVGEPESFIGTFTTYQSLLEYFGGNIPQHILQAIYGDTPSEPPPDQPPQQPSEPPIILPPTDSACDIPPPQLIQGQNGQWWSSYWTTPGLGTGIRLIATKPDGSNGYPDGPWDVYRTTGNNPQVCSLIMYSGMHPVEQNGWTLALYPVENIAQGLTLQEASALACEEVEKCSGNGPSEPPIQPPVNPPIVLPPVVSRDEECCDKPVDINDFFAWRFSGHADRWKDTATAWAGIPQVSRANSLRDLIGLREATEASIENGSIQPGDGSIDSFLNMNSSSSFQWRARLGIGDNGEDAVIGEPSEPPTEEPETRLRGF